ncbi:MAG: nitrous oxide reductase family maturation protein NosD, partial [Candidatus Thorarchaeota archaeon]
MSKSKSKLRLGSSILILFILTMSFNISIIPLVITEVTSESVILTQSSERLMSQGKINTPSMRAFETAERVIDSSYSYDSYLTNSREWDVAKIEREPYQFVPPDLSFGTPHGPILIDSNDDFDTQGWPGNGSPSTPYVIDDLIINATAGTPGISISGTDVFFVISDCVINGSYEISTGIVFNNVANALIYNNTCFEGDIGILLNQTDGISVIMNQVYSMTRAGIYLDVSDGNYIWDNIVTDCWDGIYLERSGFNDLQRNFCAGNQWGIDLYWTSNENDVYNNTLISNIACGILLYLDCMLNTIELNTLDSNGIGIFINDSDENTVLKNYSENSDCEIQLTDTQLNVINNNTLYWTNEATGLDLVNTNDTLIINNLFITIEIPIQISTMSSGIDLINNNFTHFDVGLLLWSSDDILVQDCYFDSIYNTHCIYAIGTTNIDVVDCEFFRTMEIIYAEGCEYVDIIGNHFEDCMSGIIALDSNFTTIEDNNCTLSIYALQVNGCEGAWIEDNFCYIYDRGIFVLGSNFTTVVGNHVQEGTTGIRIEISFYVDILNNDVFDNDAGETGIHLFNCGSCLISGNNLTGNVIPSILLETSHHCNVTYNVISETIDGVVLYISNHTIVTDNHITMGQGFGIGVWDSSHNFVSRNHIANISGWEGWALASNGYYNDFTYNLCDNSTIGINVEGGTDAYFTHNTVHGNDEAIWLRSTSANETVSWNVFEDNIHNGLDDSTTSLVDYNYWSNYTGVDADSDGIGDTPHPIEGTANNNDTHPLVYHPTLPTWLIEPTDQDHEYGHDFVYTLELQSPTGIAPITDWWISDSNFDVDDGTITSNVILGLGEYELEVRAYNIYGFYRSGFFNVTVADTVAPTIVGPDDFSYVVGQTGRLITWIPEDLGPASYSLSRDGVVVMSGAWNSTAENITYTADGLDIGE